MNKSKFKALEKEWYEKLKDSGFEDIEDTRDPERRLKSWHSFYFQARFDPLSFDHNQEFYSRATEFLHKYFFEKQTDKEIWRLHTEGQTVREISEYLQGKGSFSKDTVHNTIRRLTRIMGSDDWHTRKYEQFEFNFNPRTRRRR